MRIALYISPAHTVPPETKSILAPWWLVSDIADGLVRRGHEVTLFGARGSKSLAEIVDSGIEPFGYKENEMDQKQFNKYATFFEQRLASVMYKMSQEGKFDIIGSHLVTKILHFTPLTKVPTVFTLHDPITPSVLEFYKAYLNIPQISYVSISNAQRVNAPIPFAGTIYHGIHVEEFPLGLEGGEELIIVGRIRREKGITNAIDVARKTNTKLLICGEYFPQYPEIYAYWEKEVKPEIDNKIIFYKGLLTPEKMREQYKQSKALIFPIQWEEPFGMVMIEAMACGTPVVAFARGSVPEIVKDGETGFIVNFSDSDKRGDFLIKKTGFEGFAEAVQRMSSMSQEEYGVMRRNCRVHVEKNFSVENMVRGYETVYKKVLGELK